MAYSSGMLKDTIKVLNRTASQDGQFGRVSGAFEPTATIHANVKWTKGVKAMREGAMDAYDYIMVRTRWNEHLKRDSRIEWKGKVYKIETFFDDYEANEMQITAVELQI